jgi:hypothetical protein
MPEIIEVEQNPEPVEPQEGEQQEVQDEEIVEGEPAKKVEEKPVETEKAKPEEGEDEGLEFGEWAKQFGELPESIKSVEDLMRSYQGLLPEMKRTQTEAQKLQQLDTALRAKGLGGVNDLLRGDVITDFRPTPKQATQGKEPIFNTKAAMSRVNEMVESGTLIDPEHIATHKAVASMLDSAYGPQLQKSEEVYFQLAQGLNYVYGRIRDMEWDGLDSKLKGNVDRGAVDDLMKSGAFKTYADAVKYQMFQHPGMLSQLTEHARQEGLKAGLKKLRQGAIRRDKFPAPSGSKWKYDRYILANGEWNMKLMGKELSSKNQKAMLDDYLKENYSKE